MSKDLNRVQDKVFSSEFKSFCKKQFSKDMKSLEEERKKALLFALSIALGVTIGFLAVFILFGEYASSDMKNGMLASYVFFVAFSWIPINKYKRKSKNTIMPKLLAFVYPWWIIRRIQINQTLVKRLQK